MTRCGTGIEPCAKGFSRAQRAACAIRRPKAIGLMMRPIAPGRLKVDGSPNYDDAAAFPDLSAIEPMNRPMSSKRPMTTSRSPELRDNFGSGITM